MFTWTQRIKFKLINPLLGNNCYIGSDNNPIVINPELSVGPGGMLQEQTDPNPTKHPDTVTLGITAASATDTTFTAPGVTGCGPGGAKNISIDAALDAGTGLPAASGVNSLTLNGSFDIAPTYAGENMKANNAKILLSAFKDSVGTRWAPGRCPPDLRRRAAQYAPASRYPVTNRLTNAVIEGAPARLALPRSFPAPAQFCLRTSRRRRT